MAVSRMWSSWRSSRVQPEGSSEGQRRGAGTIHEGSESAEGIGAIDEGEHGDTIHRLVTFDTDDQVQSDMHQTAPI